jgi:hypothetical protein
MNRIMALVPQNLATQLYGFFQEMRNVTEIDDMAMAQKFANIIDGYIKTAQVAPGIPVATAGTAAAQTGATTAPGTLI